MNCGSADSNSFAPCFFAGILCFQFIAPAACILALFIGFYSATDYTFFRIIVGAIYELIKTGLKMLNDLIIFYAGIYQNH